jgi:peptidoglycan-associated lipoprotein
MMKLRHAAVLALAVVAFGACKKKQPAAAPAPTMAEDTAAMRRAREQARADSIAAARRAEEERAARERAAAVARVREALADKVYFEFDSDALTDESQDKLRTKVAILQANPTLDIRVAGHTDARGSTEYNLALGQRRAESVRDFITGFGISGDRVTTISYGEEQPAVEGETESAYSQNRRAEFVITGGEITTAPPEVR